MCVAAPPHPADPLRATMVLRLVVPGNNYACSASLYANQCWYSYSCLKLEDMAHFNSYCQPDKTRSGPSSRPLAAFPNARQHTRSPARDKALWQNTFHLAGHSFYGFATSALHDADDNAEFASGLKDLILSKPNETARLTLRPHDMLYPPVHSYTE